MFEGDPYEKGPFEVDILKVKSRPFHSVGKENWQFIWRFLTIILVHYPILAGNYSVQFFLGGYTGFFLARYYSNFLSKIAEHGIIVVGIDTNTFSLLDDSFSKSISSYGISQGVLETLRWVFSNPFTFFFKNKHQKKMIAKKESLLWIRRKSESCKTWF